MFTLASRTVWDWLKVMEDGQRDKKQMIDALGQRKSCPFRKDNGYPHTHFLLSAPPLHTGIHKSHTSRLKTFKNYRTPAHDTGHTVVFNRTFFTQLFIISLIFNFCSNKIILYDFLAWQEMHMESPRCTHCWRVSRMSTTDAIWKSYCSARRRLLMTR